MNTNKHKWAVEDPIQEINFKHAKLQWKCVVL